jgi:hypothetical protein
MAIQEHAVNATAGGTIPTYSLLINSSGSVVVSTAETDVVLGCSQNESAVSGEDLAMHLPGQIVKLRASAAIAKYAKVMPAADGEIATYVADTGHFPIGTALDAAAADGDIIRVFFDVEHIASA